MPEAIDTAAEVAAAQQKLTEAQAAHAAAMEATATPRAPMVVLLDFLGLVVSRFGNHPTLEKLLKEFEAAITPAS